MRSILISILAFVLRVQKRTIDFVLDEGPLVNTLLILLIPSIVINVVIYQVSPLLIKFVLDLLVDSNALDSWPIIGGQDDVLISIVYLVVFSAILMIVDNIFSFLDHILSKRIRMVAEERMEEKYFEKLGSFDLTFLSTDNNVRLLRSVGFIITTMQNRIIGFLRNFISLPTAIVSLVLVLPVLHPYFFVMILGVSVVNLVLNSFKAQRYRDWEFVLTRNQTQRNAFRWGLFYGFGRFYFNGLFENINNKYRGVREKVLSTQYNRDYQDGFLAFIQNVFNSIASSIIFFVGAFLVLAGTITVGSLALVNSYLGRFNRIFDQIGWLFGDLINLNLDLTRVEFILNLKPKISHITPFKTVPDYFDISFNNVSFTYPKFYEEEKAFFEKLGSKLSLTKDEAGSNWFMRLVNKIQRSFLSNRKQNAVQKEFAEMMSVFDDSSSEVEVLKGINLTLSKGTIYALVGKNGAGKSTLVNMLKRGFDATKGEVIAHDVNIRNIDPAVWRSSLVSIEQNILQFDGMLSLKEQLLLNVTDDKKEEKAKQAFELIKTFELDHLIPNLDMQLGENVMLSGGQRQMLELIRILVSEKPLIILDEATNQLDAEKELLFISLIKEYLPKSIVIFITHRMSTCNKVDTIISMKNGIVEAVGTPKEMVKGDNQYSRFYEIQNS